MRAAHGRRPRRVVACAAGAVGRATAFSPAKVSGAAAAGSGPGVGRGRTAPGADGWRRRAAAGQVNLFLRVTRRRDDGFHDLASLFHAIGFGDRMEFEGVGEGGTDSMTCNMPGVPTDETNLVIRALELFRAKTGCRERFRCHLEKAVPAGAGLGGGSGNAATTLWQVNEMCGRPATERQLLEWSGEIGSDISFFFSRGAAYCTGRGEIVEDVEPPLPLDTGMLLVKPSIGLSTPQIFKALDLDTRSTADPLDLMGRLAAEGPSQDACVNDLEPPAFSQLPRLKELKDRLYEEGDFDAVFMSGSGSTIVCMGSTAPPPFLEGEDVADLDLFVTKTKLVTRPANAWY